jgi:hypothetical protein
MTIPAALQDIGRPGAANVVIRQGDTWTQSFELLDGDGDAIDLTSLT